MQWYIPTHLVIRTLVRYLILFDVRFTLYYPYLRHAHIMNIFFSCNARWYRTSGGCTFYNSRVKLSLFWVRVKPYNNPIYTVVVWVCYVVGKRFCRFEF